MNRASRKRYRYTVIGILLGLGAPLGSLLLRILTGHAPVDDITQHLFFYAYQLIGTCIVFAIAGYVVGRRVDRLAADRDWLFDLSQHDELTGLLNSRAFWQRYRRAMDRDEPIVLLMLDVDQFKKINDECGHAFGDEALRRVAEAITSATRGGDDLARWGGDEFAVLMRGADTATATTIAERIRERVSREPIRHSGQQRRLSVTIGIATSSGRATAAGLFERADAALYEGKRSGRNRTAVQQPAE